MTLSVRIIFFLNKLLLSYFLSSYYIKLWLTFFRYLHKPTSPDEPSAAEQPKPLYPYRTIGCVFNHQMFLGNCQPSDSVEGCVFDLNDESKWKPMSEEAIKSVCAPGATTSLPPFPPLCASTIDASVTSNEIEMQLRLLVSEHRKVINTDVCAFLQFFHLFMYLIIWGACKIVPINILALNKANSIPSFMKLVVLKIMRIKFWDSKISKLTNTSRIYCFLLEMKNGGLVQTFVNLDFLFLKYLLTSFPIENIGLIFFIFIFFQVCLVCFVFLLH